MRHQETHLSLVGSLYVSPDDLNHVLVGAFGDSGSQALKIAVMPNDFGSLGSLAVNQRTAPKLTLSDLEQSFSQVPCGL